MSFIVDSRIETSSVWLADWPLASVYLKNDANFPWAVLVPRRKDIQEVHQLSKQDQHQLITEIAVLSEVIDEQFKPEKLNVGMLGNIVPQLHIHIVARYKTDHLWPQGVWQSSLTTIPYSQERLEVLIGQLQKKLAEKQLQCDIT